MQINCHRSRSSTKEATAEEEEEEMEARAWARRMRSDAATDLESARAPAVWALEETGAGGERRELLRLCAGQRAPVDSPSSAEGAGAVETVAELAGAAAQRGARTPKLFIHPEMKGAVAAAEE